MTRVSYAGACHASDLPAGSDGVGGLLLTCKGALEAADMLLDCCGRCRRQSNRGRLSRFVPVMNEWGRWRCDGQVLHDGRIVHPRESGGIHKAAVGMSTA